jgi:hypothetical protein
MKACRVQPHALTDEHPSQAITTEAASQACKDFLVIAAIQLVFVSIGWRFTATLGQPRACGGPVIMIMHPVNSGVGVPGIRGIPGIRAITGTEDVPLPATLVESSRCRGSIKKAPVNPTRSFLPENSFSWSLASGGATFGGYFVRVTAMRPHVHVLGFAVQTCRCRGGSYFGNLRLCTRLFLGTLLLAHFLPFGHCATSNAAHNSAHEAAVTGRMTCDTANERAFDAAFGGGDAWGERNREN